MIGIGQGKKEKERKKPTSHLPCVSTPWGSAFLSLYPSTQFSPRHRWLLILGELEKALGKGLLKSSQEQFCRPGPPGPPELLPCHLQITGNWGNRLTTWYDLEIGKPPLHPLQMTLNTHKAGEWHLEPQSPCFPVAKEKLLDKDYGVLWSFKPRGNLDSYQQWYLDP